MLFKPRSDYEDKYEKKNEKDAARSSKMTLYLNNLSVVSIVLSIVKLNEVNRFQSLLEEVFFRILTNVHSRR